MLVTVVLVGLAVAVLARRVPWVRRRMPPPASTLLTAVAGAAAATVTAEVMTDGPRWAVAGGLTVAASAVLIALAGLVVGQVVDPVRRRRDARPDSPSIRDRAAARADAVEWRVRDVNPVAVVVRGVLRAGDVRVTGLAAEMSYYALISIVPITTALGSNLGLLRPILGDGQVEEIRASIVDALTSIFAQQVAADVLAPLVDGLLDERRTGFAVGALVVTLYLASRVFRAAVRALDDAYGAATRRNIVSQYLLGLLFTLGALVTMVTVSLLVVVGPLLGNGGQIAEALGLGDAFRVAWEWLRWPAAFLVGLAFLTLLYRYAPNVETTWRRCLPGAVLGSVGLLLVSAGFLVYVRFAAPSSLEQDAGNAVVVQAAAQMLSLVLAAVLWLWLGSIVVLLGGILNAELDLERAAEQEAGRTSEREDDGEAPSVPTPAVALDTPDQVDGEGRRTSETSATRAATE
ncbi:hypothetical protein C8046_10820 [Serinibacter arcticus]|uniref:YihY/virulence factor BrkB family protein n=1 Tax=Serinibacter arcticus TaxID=1655435 RepID=A0A2U1ZVP7_9MICO|nr:YihY/virulence factor BrkB family protein [Serinibacter arcticus]PWD51065.1 hypothetical protein C8046_10820 [Serinibacter arcticus]